MLSAENKKGKFIVPSLASVTAAGNVKLPDDSKIFITIQMHQWISDQWVYLGNHI
jgi:hypothetical protein